MKRLVLLLIILLVLVALAGAGTYLIKKYPNLLTKFNLEEKEAESLSKISTPIPNPSIDPAEAIKANEEYFQRRQEYPHLPLYDPSQVK